jgi:hypothetical protein
LPLLYVDLVHSEEVINVENNILLKGLVFAHNETKVQLPLLRVFTKVYLKDERSSNLLRLFYCVCFLCEALNERGENYEVIQDIIQLLDFLFTELNHNVESFWSLKDLLMLVENGLPKVRKRESKIG